MPVKLNHSAFKNLKTILLQFLKNAETKSIKPGDIDACGKVAEFCSLIKEESDGGGGSLFSSEVTSL